MLLSARSVSGQSTVIENLTLQLADASPNSRERVDVLCRLSFEYYDYNDSLALYYAERALAESTDLKYKEGMKYSMLLTGIGYYTLSDYTRSVSALERSRRIEVPNADTLTIYALNIQGALNRNLSYYDSAMYYYNQALTMAESINSLSWIALVRKNIALVRLLEWKNQEALAQASLALETAEMIGDRSVREEVYSVMGRAHLNLYNYDSAAVYFEKSCNLSDQGSYFNRIRCALLWSDYEFRHSNFSEALIRCYAALKWTAEYEYPPQMAEIYEKLGEIYTALGQYELASKYLFEALRVCNKYKLREREGRILANIAWIYKDLKNFPASLDFLSRAQRVYEDIPSDFGISYCRNIRGLVFLLQEKYDSSLIELQASKEIRERINYTYGVSACIYNIGLVYEAMGDYLTAYDIELQSLNIEKEMANRQSLAITYNDLAKLSMKINRMSDSYDFLNTAKKLAIDTESKLQLLTNHQIRAEYYATIGNFKEAYRFQQLYQQLNDSIYTTSNQAKLAELEALYQLEQRDQQIRILNQQKKLSEKELDLQSAQINLQYIIIVFVSVAVVLLTLLARNFYRSKKRIQQANNEIIEQKEEIQAQSEELIEANDTIAQINKDLEQKVEFRTSELKQAYKELDTFFYRSSHDFRRPLTTFAGLAEVAKVTVKDKNALELFSKVRETANALDKMLFKLQAISDVGLNELVYKEIFLTDVFNSVHDQYRDMIHERGIDITFEENLKGPFYSYPAMIKLIFENLIENSILFCAPIKPFIHVHAVQNDNTVVIKFSDNGQGIDDEYKARVFDMYFRANHQSKGNGLGLYIVQKAVNKLKGQISFTSKINEGTVFTLILPMGAGAA